MKLYLVEYDLDSKALFSDKNEAEALANYDDDVHDCAYSSYHEPNEPIEVIVDDERLISFINQKEFKYQVDLEIDKHEYDDKFHVIPTRALRETLSEFIRPYPSVDVIGRPWRYKFGRFAVTVTAKSDTDAKAQGVAIIEKYVNLTTGEWNSELEKDFPIVEKSNR